MAHELNPLPFALELIRGVEIVKLGTGSVSVIRLVITGSAGALARTAPQARNCFRRAEKRSSLS